MLQIIYCINEENFMLLKKLTAKLLEIFLMIIIFILS